MGSWNPSFLPNDQQELIFLSEITAQKLEQEQLITRKMLMIDLHSVELHINPQTTSRKIYSHLFYNCPVLCNLLRGLIRTKGLSYSNGINNYPEIFLFGIKENKFDSGLFLIFTNAR
jgi:hypothetical protein